MTAFAKDLNQKQPSGHFSVDARLQRITDEILPSSPYILTLPTNYRVGSHQINDWRRGTPFGPHEEQLSYLSFLPRTFDEDNIMNAIGDWDDGEGAIKQKNPNARSGTSSPLPGQVPKKKISLADYKIKTAGQVGAKTLPQAPSQVKLQSKDSLPNASAEKTAQPKDIERLENRKRSLDDIARPEEPKPSNHGPVQPPAKKARTIPDPLPAHQAISKAPEVMKTNMHGLPPLLSPTLPSYIEEELEKAQVAANNLSATVRHGTSSTPSNSSDKRGSAAPASFNGSKKTIKGVHEAPNRSMDDTSMSKNPIINQQSKPTTSSHKVLETKHNTPKSILAYDQKSSTVNGVQNGKLLPTASGKIRKEQSGSLVASAGKSDQKHLLIVLKIPKTSRKAWGRIIKMTPRPKKPEVRKVSPISAKDTPSDRAKGKNYANGDQGNDNRPRQYKYPPSPQNTARVTSSKQAVQVSEEQNSSKTGEKRRRLTDDLAPPAGKRQKAVYSSEPPPKPSTPVRSAIKSPVLSHSGSVHKSQLSTPKRELKSSAMRRVESTEGDVKTPMGATRSSTPNIPASAERVGRHDRSASNTSASTNLGPGKAEEISFWKAEQKKYLDLGRTLKHDADPFLKSNSEYSTVDDDLKQGAAIVTETVLCYMLGFSLGDEASRLGRKLPEAAKWSSLLPYMHFVKKVTYSIPALHGLIYYLEAVCRETISSYDLERLERETLLPPAAEDYETFKKEYEAFKKEYESFKNGLVENVRQAQHAWEKGATLLPEDTFRQQYATTWANRLTTPVAPKSTEKLVPKAYGAGVYHLPLTKNSSGIEAVRMGWSFLGEWSAKESVKWEPKIGL